MRWLKLITILFLASRMVGEVQAHSVGQQPNFKINGVYSELYPVPSSNINDFGIPQDLAPGVYSINQKVSFEIDLKVLGVTYDQIKNTKFDWNFGDGQKGQGVSQSHIYKKKGSYILTITVSSPELPTAQLFQSILINVVDSSNDKIPVVKISVNGQKVQNSVDIVYADLNKPVEVELVDGNKFESVMWNFSDGTEVISGNRISHMYPIDKYPGGLSIVSATVRAKTSEGFIVDGYAQIYDKSLKTSSVPMEDINYTDSKSNQISKKKLLVVSGVIFAFGLMGLVVWRQLTYKK